MPSRNIIKYYRSNSIYHIYNRGVEKRVIFEDNQDYRVFLSYLKEYLSPFPQSNKLFSRDLRAKYHDEIKLLAFCLMPNHIHMLIKQKDKDSIKKFTQSLFTRYSMYFNKKYDRVGKLFQGAYKATNVDGKKHLLYLSKYIHSNLGKNSEKMRSDFSSYKDYLGITNTVWIDKSIILNEFKSSAYIKNYNIKTYQEFVEEFDDNLFQYNFLM